MSDNTDISLQTRNQPLSVSELAHLIKGAVEKGFTKVRVQGEISNFKCAASGHCYFRLKDDSANLNAIIWRGTAQKLSIQAKDGMQVVAVGRVTTYESRSEYQIIIEHLEAVGVGALLEELEQRRQKLDAEGLFASAHKKPLPPYPETIGIITSPTGAVIQDITTRLSERLAVQSFLYPTRVQGKGVGSEIALAIRNFNSPEWRQKYAIPKPDLLIIARGGGSLEDLWEFNDEGLVRCVFDSEIPIISAVGHESDTTLIDYAADRRAPTPTAAAEIAVKRVSDVTQILNQNFITLQKYIANSIDNSSLRVARLPAPQRLLEAPQQRLDHACERLTSHIATYQHNQRQKLATIKAALQTPQAHVKNLQARYSAAIKQFDSALNQTTAKHQWRFASTAQALHAAQPTPILQTSRANLTANSHLLDKNMQGVLTQNNTQYRHAYQLLENSGPRQVLKRGFTIVRRQTSNGEMQTCTKASQLKANQRIAIEFYDGNIEAIVDSSSNPPPKTASQKPQKPKTNLGLFE